MRTELVTIPTDTTPLDGALHLPDVDSAISGSALLFHGNTMNFYVGPPRFLPPALTKLGLACLSFNRRGHDVLSNRDSRDLEGGAFQTIAQAIDDNRRASEWMAARGFADPFVIGHSNGGMLAVRHVADHPGTPGLVLLSAHRGGKGLMKLMAANGLMASDRFDEITADARALVAAGEGATLLLVPGWWYVISAQTYVEFLDHCPDILDDAGEIPCPTLFIRDSSEPPDLYPAEGVAERSPHPVTIRILDVGGHYYIGGDRVVTETVVEWLAGRLA
jgi:pimeloyl-ACP methyl ester carboxylesterase